MITKIEAAKRQLDTAIKLFFENVDHLSSCALALASCEITDDLIDKQRDEIYRSELERLGNPVEVRLSSREELGMIIKPEHLKESFKILRRKKNFLKHADKDHDQEIEEVSTEELSINIIFAIRNFTLLGQRMTPAMSIFFSWFAAANPHLMKSHLMNQGDDSTVLITKMRDMFHDLVSHDLHSKLAFYRMYEGFKGSASYLFPQNPQSYPIR